MWDKALNESLLIFFYIPDQYKTHKMHGKIISNDPF